MDGPKGHRVPHASFGPGPVLSLTGPSNWWHKPGADACGGWNLTATILTQAGDGVMADIHHRMPAFLTDKLIHDWLDPSIVGPDLLPAVTETSPVFSLD